MSIFDNPGVLNAIKALQAQQQGEVGGTGVAPTKRSGMLPGDEGPQPRVNPNRALIEKVQAENPDMGLFPNVRFGEDSQFNANSADPFERIAYINDQHYDTGNILANTLSSPTLGAGIGGLGAIQNPYQKTSDYTADDVADILIENGINSSADLKQSVKGSHNDNYANLGGLGNQLYTTPGSDFYIKGGSGRRADPTQVRNAATDSNSIGQYTLGEHGQFEKPGMFGGAGAEIFANLLAPLTLGGSVVVQKALSGATGDTLHTNDFTDAAKAVVGGQLGGGEFGQASAGELGRAAYNQRHNLATDNTPGRGQEYEDPMGELERDDTSIAGTIFGDDYRGLIDIVNTNYDKPILDYPNGGVKEEDLPHPQDSEYPSESAGGGGEPSAEPAPKELEAPEPPTVEDALEEVLAQDSPSSADGAPEPEEDGGNVPYYKVEDGKVYERDLETGGYKPSTGSRAEQVASQGDGVYNDNGQPVEGEGPLHEEGKEWDLSKLPDLPEGYRWEIGDNGDPVLTKSDGRRLDEMHIEDMTPEDVAILNGGVTGGGGGLSTGGVDASPGSGTTGTGTTGTTGDQGTTDDGQDGKNDGPGGDGPGGDGPSGEGEGGGGFFGGIGGDDWDMDWRTLAPSRAANLSLMDYVAALQKGR